MLSSDKEEETSQLDYITGPMRKQKIHERKETEEADWMENQRPARKQRILENSDGKERLCWR